MNVLVANLFYLVLRLENTLTIEIAESRLAVQKMGILNRVVFSRVGRGIVSTRLSDFTPNVLIG